MSKMTLQELNEKYKHKIIDEAKVLAEICWEELFYRANDFKIYIDGIPLDDHSEGLWYSYYGDPNGEGFKKYGHYEIDSGLYCEPLNTYILLLKTPEREDD